MDEYTEKTRAWLNEQFKICDEEGIWIAHQPIYGFKKGHCQKAPPISRYIPTYQIMKVLAHIDFHSLLDVGGAEGYKAALVREIFGASVRNSDLSDEVCKRAQEIFRIKSDPVDIHCLPYEDNQFDVVLCSETLEHVTDFSKAINELLRVAAKAVVITVPHDPKDYIEENVRKGKIHGHIRGFAFDSFNFLKARGYRVIPKKIMSPHTSTRLLSKFSNLKFMVALLISFDELAAKLLSSYGGILIIILKDKAKIHWKKIGRVSAFRIVNFKVPEYYLGRKRT